ncbi:MAG: zinc ribbon domain-containing protein [Gammaproteobacteria bacterium]|nr:zinc ribbon domain-containing protein [Pseudomonadales bacterium]MCP5345964.1 zinc ribbon domain-containing protein [Pseudomonadales bacterium]
MPIYEYRCSNCGHELEALQKISDAALVHCPACEQDALKKLVSAASFRLKGGGWYETDFKNSRKKHLADSGSGDKSDKDNKSDEKPAATPEKKPDSKGSSNSSADQAGSKN